MSQGALNVPTTGPVAPTTMAADINAALNATNSQNSGSSSPTNGPGSAPVTYQWWMDSTSVSAPILKMFDGSAWVALATLDTVNHLWKAISAGFVSLTGVITPTPLSADANDYAPTDLAKVSRIRLSASADLSTVSWNLTGLTDGSDGRQITIDNINTLAKFVLKTQSGSSGVTNRFAFPFDIILRPNESVTLIYDGTTQRWRLAHPYRGPGITYTVLTAASGTYSTPAGCTCIKVRAVGGGGGGSGSIGTSGAGGVGGAGGTTTFGSANAIGGNGGPSGAGGTGGTGAVNLRIPGATGNPNNAIGAYTNSISFAGTSGGASPFGGAGGGAAAAKANTGSGGGGGSVNIPSGNCSSGGGGGAGEYFELIISNPASSYAYAVGAAGAAGTAGSGGNAGGAGGSGVIVVEEYYN